MNQNTIAPVTKKFKTLSFDTRHFGKATVVRTTYYPSNRLAVVLVNEARETLAVLSVNIPEFSHFLGEREFFAKTWSENADIAEDALASGLFEDTDRTSGGVLEASIWKIK